MDWVTLGAIHDRIRAAQLPGYALHYSDGSDQFCMTIYDANDIAYSSKYHSAAILLEWADETLLSIGA